MNEVKQYTQARERRNHGLSLVWTVPIVALIVTISLLLSNLFGRGDTVYITAPSADGIEAGKTLVKMRAVNIGMVTAVNLDEDFQKVVITVEMDEDTDELLREDTVFWVVKPRVEGVGITGLETILTGAYIQCHPGTSETPRHRFTITEDPPTITDGQSGRKFTLEYGGSRKIRPGDLIEYRGLRVGTVLSSTYDVERGRAIFSVFVRDPYTKMFNSSTRFWVNSGIDMSLTSGGFNLNTDSLMSIIQGGLAFDNLSQEPGLPYLEIKSGTIFDSKSDAYTDYLREAPSYIILLDRIYRNLQAGSDVLHRGVKIGKVTKNPFVSELRYLFSTTRIPVLMSLDLRHSDEEYVQSLIEEALLDGRACVHIDSAGLLSTDNQLQLSLDGQCSQPVDAPHEFQGYRVIPLSTSGLEGDVGSIISKLNDIDTRGISAELKRALQSFADAMNSINKATRSANDQKLIENLANAAKSFNSTIESYGSDTEVYLKLNDVLSQVNKMLQDVGPAVNEFGQKPNALIFPNSEQDIIPRRAAQ